MTDREKAIVMAYTGVTMLKGNKLNIFYKYIEEIIGRPVMTHETECFKDYIKEKSKPDFIALCANEETDSNMKAEPFVGRCIDCTHMEVWREGRCVFHPNVVCDAHTVCSDYCFKGGKK